MDAVWENAKGTYLLICSHSTPQSELSCIHPLQKWLVTTVSSLGPERAMNCMCYPLLYIHRKCCYLY